MNLGPSVVMSDSVDDGGSLRLAKKLSLDFEKQEIWSNRSSGSKRWVPGKQRRNHKTSRRA